MASEHGAAPTSLTESLPVVCIVLRRLWFLFVITILNAVMFGSVGPLFQYVVLTFFASYHGGGDCMEAPQSMPCRLAAGDLTTYNSAMGCLTSIVTTVTALTLGSLSDSIGRRRIFITKGVLTVTLLYALALYQLAGVSLWFFLVLRPLVAMWDFNGVILALLADVFPEQHLRGLAMSTLIAVVLLVALACASLAAVLPVSASFAVALTAATTKLVFYFTLFPETATVEPSSDACRRKGPVGALRAACQIITRNTFILRVACVAVISGASSVGTGLTVQPYLTSYVGMKRGQLSGLFAVIVASVLVTLGVLAKPVIRYCGDVRTYQLCLFCVALMPAGLCLCAEPGQVTAFLGILTGPLVLQFPIVSAIKSRLVRDAEQGLVQGALAALVNLAFAVASPLFGWLYGASTQGGAARSRSAAFPPLLAASGVGMAAFLVSLSLPLELPETAAGAPGEDLGESLLRAEG